jgi:hypothetical protein
MTFTLTDAWLFALQALPVAGIIYTFFATRRQKMDDAIAAAKIDAATMIDTAKTEHKAAMAKAEADLKVATERLDRHQGRLDRLDQSVASLPGKEDMHQLQIQMIRISGTMDRMEAVMEGSGKIMSRLEAIVTRHEEHLLSENRK